MVEVYRFRDGKICDVRYYYDAFSLLRQLGIGAAEMAAKTSGDATWPAAMH